MRRRQLLSKLLESCTDAPSLAQLHSLLLRAGLLAAPDCFFATRLVSSYGKHASPDSARKLFDEIPRANTFLWNAVLRAHSRARQWPQSLLLFRRMPASLADAYTLPIALKASAALSALGLGRAIHGLLIKKAGIGSDMFVAAALIEMYSKFGEMGSAVKVFDRFPDPDVVLRTSVVTGYQQNGLAEEAVSFFSRMVVGRFVTPDPVTLVSVVSALGQLRDLRLGKSCHGFLIKLGFDSELALVNAVLNLYSKLGAAGAARRLFEVMPERDVVTWSCMISCYAQNGSPVDALGLYKRMVGIGLEPNSVTVVCVLQACASARDLQEGRRVHELTIHRGFESELAVSTALIDMYMKCSCYSEAMDLFHRLQKKDVVSWAAVIGGYAQNGLANESLEVFRVMLLDGPCPDAVTMVKVLTACSHLGILCQALCYHSYLVKGGFDDKVFVGAALIDLYSKCGSLVNAVRIFESLDQKDVVLWSSMIAGYGIHGLGSKAIATFERMVRSSIRPNSVTFVSLLSACSHAGLVEEGRRMFDTMNSVYGVKPDSEHYGIMVDLLGRNGEFDEAMRLIDRMPSPVGAHVWCALLAGCRIHHNTEMGELAANNLLKLESDHTGYYNLLSNMYASEGKWDKVVGIKSVLEERGLKKTSAYSAVELVMRSALSRQVRQCTVNHRDY